MACKPYQNCAPPSPSDSYLACSSAQAIFTEDQVAQYANRAGAQGGTGNWVYCYVVACLRVNRIIYYKATPGDCTGGSSGVYSPSTETKASAALAQAASTDAEPISRAVLQIGGSIFGIFGQAHIAAVANEQTTLCQAAIDYNSFASYVESGLQNGAKPLQDALASLPQVIGQIETRIAGIEMPVNAAYGVHKALDALALMNKEFIYPSLVNTPSLSVVTTPGAAPVAIPGSAAPLASIPGVSAVQNAINAIPGVSYIPGGSSTVLLLGLALIGWKLIFGRR